MSALLLVIIVLLGVLVWLLSIPLELVIDIDTLATQKACVRLRWFYGLVTFNPQVSAAEPETAEQRAAGKQRKSARTMRRQGGGFFWAMMRSEGFVGRIVKLLRDGVRALDFRETRLYCRFGLDDPADTGQCLGVVAPLFILLRRRLIPTARLEPDFTEAVLVLQAGTRLRIIPLRYLFLLLQFLVSPALWRGIRAGLEARSA